LGFPLAITALLIKYWRSRDPYYLSVTRKLTIVLFINFALGAVFGTLVEFGLVQIWPGTIIAIASFALVPLALELIALLVRSFS
jgi:cytochrome bd quinol oxidase subunit 1 apoprotein (EC 1.10.3.-)